MNDNPVFSVAEHPEYEPQYRFSHTLDMMELMEIICPRFEQAKNDVRYQ